MTAVLEQRTIVITGAAAGIGLGIARACAAAGATLVLADIDYPRLVEVTRGLVDPDSDRHRFRLDVGNRAEVTEFFRAIGAGFDRIDGLVNNAGVTIESDFLAFSEQDLDLLWRTNLRSVFLMCQEAGRAMKRTGGGSIVNISSVHATASIPGYEMYAGTKAGIAAMTRAMSWSLGPHGIRVNALSPGLTNTEKLADMVKAQPEREAGLRAMHATGSYASVDEIGSTAVFLLSDAASAITGANLTVDHGESVLLAAPETLRFDSQ